MNFYRRSLHILFRFQIPLFSTLIGLILVGQSSLLAQGDAKADDKAKSEAKQDDDKKEVPEPEVVKLKTKDRVNLRCFWYPGMNEKETVPIIILHGWKGKAADHAQLARYLQKEFGHAVLVPDLRGHGESLVVDGSDRDIDIDKMKKAEVLSVSRDIDACRKFFFEKNNEGEVNIDHLTLVATGESCIHAVAWAIQDWSWPDLNGVRQGRDVKAVVLISPKRKFKGLNMSVALKNPLFTGQRTGIRPLSALILHSSDASAKQSVREATAIYNAMKKHRPEVVISASEPAAKQKERWEKQDLYIASGKGSGAEITNPSLSRLAVGIANFIQYRVVEAHSSAKWRDRSSD